MAISKRDREKLSQSKIDRKVKPYIDKDLQLHIPASEQVENHEPFNKVYAYSPIYNHFNNSSLKESRSNALLSEINEEEIFQAIHDAEQAYEAWRKLKNQLEKNYQIDEKLRSNQKK